MFQEMSLFNTIKLMWFQCIIYIRCILNERLFFMFKRRVLSLFILMVVILSSILFPLNCVATEAFESEDINNVVIAQNKYDFKDYIIENKDVEVATDNIAVNCNNVLLETEKTVSFDFYIAKSGMYAINIKYETIDSGREPLKAACKLDDKIPYSDFEQISLPRCFEDIAEIRKDNDGNEISKEIKQIYGEYQSILKDKNNSQYLLINLGEGNHNLKIQNNAEEFKILEIVFIPKPESIKYDAYLNKYKGIAVYDKYDVYEAENTYFKSSNNLTQLTDNTSANVNPYNATRDMVNYIGGKNWSQPGDTISWKIKVPEDGLYSIGLNYRQNYTVNTSFYREVKIDGEVPFNEASYIELPYALNWEFTTLSDKSGEPYLFYLTKGEHTISFSVTLGKLSEVCNDLEEISYNIASLYRSIVMITGDTPDANRDYNLFERISDFNKQLDTYVSQLKNVNKDLSNAFGNDSVSAISTINGMINVMELMSANKYTAHKYINRYYDCYASLSSMLMELKSMPLDIDRIYVGNNFSDTKTGFFKTLFFSVKRFIMSFAKDYNNYENGEREKITIWVNWGRDQAKVLKYLIQSDFSVKHNIDVDIKITNATLTHAALSGDGPDCQLHLSRSEPVNLAMRDAVYDLTKFEDYKQVATRFLPTASDCYKFKDGIYALPDTQTFFMMFIRKDIFAQLGLEVPKTWDEFINTSTLLLRQNMQVGLPYTQIAEMTQVNLGVGALSIYPTLLIQNGGRLYNDNHSQVELLSEVSIDTFTQWTDFYTKYGLPKTYDFFNRFRLGLMPMAIQNYTLYANLTAAAPEITDYWEMYELPGTVNEDGSINNITTGGGTGAVILSASKNKEEAWEFIKWWTSTDIQYRYGVEVENILGSAARVATANVDALKQYSWKSSTLKNILSQSQKVVEMPEVPGGYYVSRVLDQAFWNVTNANENPKDMLMKWNDIAQTEITRKREQYNID